MKYGYLFISTKEISNSLHMHQLPDIDLWTLNPDILLLDEPFSSLDYQSKIVVQEDIYKIIKDYNKTTILVTHDISEAIAMADVVYILTSRPSTIKSKYEINLDIDNKDKTPLSARKTNKFQDYFSAIWKELDFKDI